MINKLLRAKHWQIFLLVVGIPIIAQIALGVMVSAPIDQDRAFFPFLEILPILSFGLMAIFAAWFWAVGTGLQQLIPTNLQLKVSRFRLAFFFPLAYGVYLIFFFVNVIRIFAELNPMDDAQPNLDIQQHLIIIIPLHLISMFCILYCMYFVAKTFKTAVLQRKVTFLEYLGTIFAIWFFPIGIWSIQPQINDLVKDTQFRSDSDGMTSILDNEAF